MVNLCLECGEDEESHGHVFQPSPQSPNGCECNPGDWRDPFDIPDVCVNAFIIGMDGLCINCSHIEECHKE